MTSKSVRSALLDQARHRCCTHRLAWLDTAIDHTTAARWRPLEVHHVVFQSLGGSDEPDNLLPLCPSCHTLIHSTRRIGNIIVDDTKLRELWALWKHFAELIPSVHHIGMGDPTATARFVLNVYGLEVTISVDNTVLFYEARDSLLHATIGVLAAADPYFPFPRGREGPSTWSTSFDDIAKPWNRYTAEQVFARTQEPLRVTAPVIITMNHVSRPVFYGDDEQRTI